MGDRLLAFAKRRLIRCKRVPQKMYLHWRSQIAPVQPAFWQAERVGLILYGCWQKRRPAGTCPSQSRSQLSTLSRGLIQIVLFCVLSFAYRGPHQLVRILLIAPILQINGAWVGRDCGNISLPAIRANARPPRGGGAQTRRAVALADGTIGCSCSMLDGPWKKNSDGPIGKADWPPGLPAGRRPRVSANSRETIKSAMGRHTCLPSTLFFTQLQQFFFQKATLDVICGELDGAGEA